MQDEEKPEESSNDMLPVKVNTAHFSATNQPSGASKSMGWFKRNKGRKMMKALLQMTFDGSISEDGKTIPNEIKRQAAIYFGVPEKLITIEMVMAMRQIGLAIQKGDTNAFNSAWEKAYGKPKEVDEGGIDDAPPVINIYLGNMPETPEIKETEHEDKSDNNYAPGVDEVEQQ